MRVKIKRRTLTTAASMIRFTVIIIGIALGNSQPYNYYGPLTWDHAKSYCECTGHLAVLDTQAEQEILRETIKGRDGRCAWIGASNVNRGREFRWIELPTNYNQLETNGQVLINFPSGEQATGADRAVCIYSDGTMNHVPVITALDFICELTECGPGRYKGIGEPRDDWCYAVYGAAQVESCVPCPEGTIKSVSGDDPALCLDVCDGTTSVPNAARTACVCNAGFYRNGSVCVMCSGNEVKTRIGDETNCSADPPCDGIIEVPNTEHTGCVCNVYTLEDGSCSMTRRSGLYNLKEERVEITSGSLISVKVSSKQLCAVECAKRSCKGFSFRQLPPDVGTCNMALVDSMEHQPLEGAEYYTQN